MRIIFKYKFILANLLLVIFCILTPLAVLANSSLAKKLSGRILLQVEAKGEAWYINPDNLQRYYMGTPLDAFDLMRTLGLGISNNDFDSINNTSPQRLSGKILIKVEDFGKAYYINPVDLSLHYLGSPLDAFSLMRKLGLGISNSDLNKIKLGSKDQAKYITKQNVPFTAQAPFAEWSIAMFQDGCEEASMIMAMSWVNDEKLNPQIAKEQIQALSEYELEHLGGYRDRSAHDTAELIKDYFKYQNIEYKENVTINDLIKELQNGHIIIAPMNGQKLKNIYFTPPGAINHMLVITGYDKSTNEFLTNDPGTKRGKDYRYNQEVLFNSLRDYPTGHHEPNLEVNKNIIVVKK